jgi:hypothetical protein
MVDPCSGGDSLKVSRRKWLLDPWERFDRAELRRMEQARHQLFPVDITRFPSSLLPVIRRQSRSRTRFDYFEIRQQNGLEGERSVC